MTQPVEEFANTLIQHVRDTAIAALDQQATSPRSVVGQRWVQLAGQDLPTILAAVIPDAVDEVLFQLLHAIDEGLLPLSYRDQAGASIDLAEAGESEMAGYYLSVWRGELSSQRHSDDYSDLDADDL